MDESKKNDGQFALELMTDIVSSFVSNNSVQVNELPELMKNVHATITGLSSGSAAVEAPREEQRPAVPVKKSVTDDYIVCLEDGKKFKSLKRHLMTHYNLSPEEYRQKWSLPADYPMVAPNYAAARSRLAKQMGLGRKAGSRLSRAA